MEIERKFLLDLDKVPYDFSKLTKKSIEQGYIIFNPEIRVRSISGNEYFMTIKGNTDNPVVREEVELKISRDAYNSLIARSDVYKIMKNRYVVNEANNRFEIDVYEGKLKGLACLEVEFPSVEAAEKFIVPDWVEKEVTGDSRYRNSSLARNNIPLEM